LRRRGVVYGREGTHDTLHILCDPNHPWKKHGDQRYCPSISGTSACRDDKKCIYLAEDTGIGDIRKAGIRQLPHDEATAYMLNIVREQYGLEDEIYEQNDTFGLRVRILAA